MHLVCSKDFGAVIDGLISGLCVPQKLKITSRML